MDALERDLKREALGLVPTSQSKEKMDLNVTLEMAKSHCKPLIDMSMFEPTANPILDQAVSLVALPQLAEPMVAVTQQGSFQDMAHMLDPSTETLTTKQFGIRIPISQSFFNSDGQQQQSLVDATSSSEPMTRNDLSFGSGYDFGNTATESDASSVIDDKGSSSSNKRLYKCEDPSCGRSFKRFQHLQRHMLCHTGERPYVCTFPNCGKSFSRADNLSVHQKRHNPAGFKENGAPGGSPLMQGYRGGKDTFGEQQQQAKSPMFPMPPLPFDSSAASGGYPSSFRPLNFGQVPQTGFNYGMLTSPKSGASTLDQYAYSNGEHGGYSYSFV